MRASDQPVVLIVDDEPDVAEAYAAHARDRYEVETAHSGEGALEVLDDEVDVALLDRRMPDLVGDDVLAEIRDRGLDVRVAMVTAVDADFDIIDMEFDDYVVKPVSRDELLGTIDRLLRCASYERNLREFYRVSRTLATLRATKDSAELAENEEVQELANRREELRETLSSAADRLADEDFETLFRDLDR